MERIAIRRCAAAPAILPLRANGGLTTRAASSLVADQRRVTVVARRDARRQARERDRLVERRAEGAARDLAVAVRGAHLLVRAQHAALVGQQRARSAAACGGLRDERRLADEIARAREIDGPGEAGVERRHVSRPCPGRRGSCRLRGAACRARRGRAGRTPAAASACQSAAACVAGSTISKPSSPV